MEVNIINDLGGLSSIKSNWETLETKSKKITFYNTYKYIFSWAKEHQSNFEELFVICVYERKEIIGIAPLMITKKRALSLFEYRKLCFLGKGDFFNFLIEDRPKTRPIIAKVFEAIFKQAKWDKLDLTHIRKDSPLLSFLLRSSTYNKKTHFFGENPVVIKENHIDFVNYKRNHIRKNVNNYVNKLNKTYNIQFKVYLGNEKDILNKISAIHIQRNNKNENRKSLFEQLKTRSHLESIYSQKDNTLTFTIENEDEIISYVTCFVYKDIIHAWNNSYNVNYEKYSPGDIVYMEGMKYFFDTENKFTTFDFGGGRYAWKFQMTNDFISMYRLNFNKRDSKKYQFLNWYDKIFAIGKTILTK